MYPIIKQGIVSAKKYVPDLQAGVFIDHVAPELEDHIDIWLSKFNTVAKLRLVRKLKNKKVWTYNNIGVSTFHAPASVPRLFYWLAHRYDINGYLYSEINVYNDNSEMERTDIPYNKRVNHAWFYPGAKPGMTMASLRMELSRDGLDDYDYLAMYRKFSGGKALPPAIRKVLPVMDRNGRLYFKVSNNRQLQRFREMLAREIVKLKNKR